MLEKLVNEDNINELYLDKRNMNLSNYQDILPLNEKNLDSEKGQSLLYIAAWTYFTGFLDRNYYPRIHHKNLEKNKEKFSKLSMCPVVKNKNLLIRSDSGLIGRMIYLMGVTRRKKINPNQLPFPKFMTYLKNTKHYSIIKEVFESLGDKIILDKYENKEEAEKYAKSIGEYFNKKYEVIKKVSYTSKNSRRCKIEFYYPKIN